MPIYEYRCETCGQVNEFLVLRKDEQHRCKQCGGQDLTKLNVTYLHRQRWINA